MKESVFEYKITADDYLIHQLFGASMSPTVKKQRKRGLILWSSAFFILALVFYLQGNTYLTLYFSVFGLGFIFIYPLYSRWIYKRFYKRYVYKNLKESNIEDLSLKIGEDITLSNGKEEGKMSISSIEKIQEISTHIFIKLNEGKNLIIPKQKIQNKEELQDKIGIIAQENAIEYTKNLNWKWR